MDKLMAELKRRGFTLGKLLFGSSASLSPNAEFCWSPELSFDEIIGKIRERDSGLIGEILAFALIEPSWVKIDLDKAKLKIEIDFDKVYSLESLKKIVTENIEVFYRVAVILGDVIPKKRPNMVDFDIILKVGDMRREGKTNQEIAKLISPRRLREKPESAIREISRLNKRYKELVNEMGFLKLSNP